MNRTALCFLLLLVASTLPASWPLYAVASSPVVAAVESAKPIEKSPSTSADKARPWLIYLVQHTHTDIGYTRPQAEILATHLRFIDSALDCCDLTDSYPDDAKFRWTCESLWVVREYLKRRPPAQIERFKKRVAEGRIEVTAMQLNMSEIATESSLAASLQAVRELREQFGIPIRLAMQDDVNGAAWCLVDYFADSGIRFLTMGINKTRSLLPFDKPTAFWWESSAGNRMLAFRAEHYLIGNSWGINKGKIDVFKSHVMSYLQSLEQRNYPFDCVSIQFSGFTTDNSPPASSACDLVKIWNETHKSPRLRMATASEFMDYVSDHYADALPVYRAAWPDWWTDGFGSAARETAQSRATHAHLQATQGLLAIALFNGQDLSPDVRQRMAAVQEGLLFYDEHTFGSAVSISDPTAETTMEQWEQKSSYVWDAAKQAAMLQEEAAGFVQDQLPRAKVPTLAVFNTLNWKRSGLVQLFIDSQILSQEGEVCFKDAETGEIGPARMIAKGRGGAYWAVWTNDVPPLGHKTYRIQQGEAKTTEPEKAVPPTHTISNRFYTITLDPEIGAVKSLYDKETNLELVDQECPWHLGQVVYERHQERDKFQQDAFQRTTVRNVKLQNGIDGPIYKSIVVQADLDGAEPGSVRAEIRLYETQKRIELHYVMRKLPVTEPEAVYVAFPFRWQDGKVLYEAQGGIVEPGSNQLPGSASDWHTVQNFIAVRNSEGQIVLGSDQIPLVQFSDLNLGKWQPVTCVEKPHIYSWIMNNYWFTNFRATQEGEFRWSYYLTSSRDASNNQAVRFGWGSRVPLIPRVVPAGNGDGGRFSDSMLRSDATNLLVVESRPAYDGKGIILHLREVDGKSVTLDLSHQQFSRKHVAVVEVNALEETLNEGFSSISFAPFEVKFIRVIPVSRVMANGDMSW